MSRPSRLVVGLLLCGSFGPPRARTASAAPPAPAVLENPYFRYTISRDGKNLAFVSRATASNYLKPGATSPCAMIRREGKEHRATSASLADGHAFRRLNRV